MTGQNIIDKKIWIDVFQAIIFILDIYCIFLNVCILLFTFPNSKTLFISKEISQISKIISDFWSPLSTVSFLIFGHWIVIHSQV